MRNFKVTFFLLIAILIFAIVKVIFFDSQTPGSPNLLNAPSPIVSVTASPAITPVFQDLQKGHWAYDSVNSLIAKDRFKDYSPVKFLPNQTMSRAQFANIFTVGMGVSAKKYLQNDDQSEKINLSEAVSAVVGLLGLKATKAQLEVVDGELPKNATSKLRNAYAVAYDKSILPPVKDVFDIKSKLTRAEACYVLNETLKHLRSNNAQFQAAPAS